MAVSIDDTVGSASANSYVTLAEADTYMESRLNASSWGDASTDDQNRSLVEATRQLTLLIWVGRRADDVQALSWPRQFAVNPDDPNNDYFATDVVPDRVQDGTMELAFQYIKAGTTDVSALDPTANVIRKKIDVLETEYSEPFARARGLDRYPSVMQHIQCLLISSGASRPSVKG